MRELTHWQDWDVVELIGRGSFGDVYEIERKLFDETEKAALKVISIPQNETEVKTLRSEGYDDESITMVFNDQLQGILKEYMLMRKLNGNTNVVNCDDVQRVQHDDGMGWDIFIKMELLQPMAESLPRTVSDEQVIKIGSDICNALILCSRFNIIHRDIKPQNIFVSPYGDYKLGDFGVARTMERTAGGTKIGTYNYMAPEVYNNQKYNHTVDIYSLGLVLYWLLNERRMPFMPLPPAFPKASDQETSRYRRFRGEALPAPKHGSDRLKAIVLKACAFDPEERYQSAAEMKQALEALGKTEDKLVETVPMIDMLTEDDPTMGAWAPVVKTPPVIEIVPAAEPVVEDNPILDDEDTVIPTKNEDKTVGMWAAIEAERERKRKEAEEAERQRIEAEQKRLAEEAAEKERQRLLEEQRIRDEKAAELKRLKEQEEKKKQQEKPKKNMLPLLLVFVILIAVGVGVVFSSKNSANRDNSIEQPIVTDLSTENKSESIFSLTHLTKYAFFKQVVGYPPYEDNGKIIVNLGENSEELKQTFTIQTWSDKSLSGSIVSADNFNISYDGDSLIIAPTNQLPYGIYNFIFSLNGKEDWVQVRYSDSDKPYPATTSIFNPTCYDGIRHKLTGKTMEALIEDNVDFPSCFLNKNFTMLEFDNGTGLSDYIYLDESSNQYFAVNETGEWYWSSELTDECWWQFYYYSIE